jgi:spore germination cell wall hydrolase CwlJ-like protein
LRNQSKGARLAPFGFGFALFALLPNEIGYQDIASLLARQPGVTERWQKRVFASSAAAVQVATFSFARPIGTAAQETVNHRLASLGGGQNLDSDGVEITGSIQRNPLGQTPRRYQASDFPKVDRTLKGDRLLASPATDDQPTADSFKTNRSVMGAKTAQTPAKAAPLDADLAAALQAPPLTASGAADVSLSLETNPLNDSTRPVAGVALGTTPTAPRDSFAIGTASLFFGNSALGDSAGMLERWEPGEEPTIVADPDFKVASLPNVTEHSGQSVAGKGEVNSDNTRNMTPAERLGLFDEKARAKQEKCLADAVYFEARGEAVRGQIAVAQVVMNRAFSGYYPTTPCGVVYQNSHRHLACQFTFACDGIRDVVKEPDMWDRARRIAKETLDGRLWLPEVGKSTHYHAYWVHPSWVREMKKQYRFGVHTFYRPRNWGDGANAPSWGSKEQTAEIAASLAALKP